jgi:hypothetical protein
MDLAFVLVKIPPVLSFCNRPLIETLLFLNREVSRFIRQRPRALVGAMYGIHLQASLAGAQNDDIDRSSLFQCTCLHGLRAEWHPDQSSLNILATDGASGPPLPSSRSLQPISDPIGAPLCRAFAAASVPDQFEIGAVDMNDPNTVFMALFFRNAPIFRELVRADRDRHIDRPYTNSRTFSPSNYRMVVHNQTFDGVTLLSWAVLLHDFSAMRFLLSEGRTTSLRRGPWSTDENEHAVHLARRFGETHAERLLLDMGHFGE